MTKRLYTLAALAVATTPAFATDLWNQQVGLANGFNGFVDEQFTDTGFTQYSTYQSSDVVVGTGGWNVTSISEEFLDNGATSGITTALLNVFPNTGANSLPAVQNDPTTGTQVAVQITSLGAIGANAAQAYLLTASGLNLQLAAGEYWIGLTGIGAFGSGEIQEGFTTTNSAGANFGSAFINPQGGFAAGTSWQPLTNITGDSVDYSAIDIQGSFATPEPASMALLGLGVVGLIKRRRNRK